MRVVGKMEYSEFKYIEEVINEERKERDLSGLWGTPDREKKLTDVLPEMVVDETNFFAISLGIFLLFCRLSDLHVS